MRRTSEFEVVLVGSPSVKAIAIRRKRLRLRRLAEYFLLWPGAFALIVLLAIYAGSQF